MLERHDNHAKTPQWYPQFVFPPHGGLLRNTTLVQKDPFGLQASNLILWTFVPP